MNDNQIIQACQAYHTDQGILPNQNSGNASKWCGQPITWSAINQQLRVRGTTLYQLQIAHGLR